MIERFPLQQRYDSEQIRAHWYGLVVINTVYERRAKHLPSYG